jgi:hypothetical protein
MHLQLQFPRKNLSFDIDIYAKFHIDQRLEWRRFRSPHSAYTSFYGISLEVRLRLYIHFELLDLKIYCCIL